MRPLLQKLIELHLQTTKSILGETQRNARKALATDAAHTKVELPDIVNVLIEELINP
ncbi:hypothetical protein [Cupriavidus sp. PET2-C1]